MQAAHYSRWGFKAAALLLVSTVLSGCGINTIPTLDEQAKAA
jgi:LemA protein